MRFVEIGAACLLLLAAAATSASTPRAGPEDAGIRLADLAYDRQLGMEIARQDLLGTDLPDLVSALVAERQTNNCAALSEASDRARSASRELRAALTLNESLCWSFLGQPEAALRALETLALPDSVAWEVLAAHARSAILAEADRSRDAIEPLQRTVALSAEHGGFEELHAIALARLAFARAVLGEQEVARRLIDDSLLQARRIGSPRAEGVVINQLGGIQIIGGDLIASIASMEAARQVLLATDDHLERMLILCNLAYAYTRAGEFEAARTALHEALGLPTERISPSVLAILNSRLGYLYLTLGDWQRAEVFLRRGVEYYQALNDEWRHAMALRLWATARRELGDIPGSIAAQRTALGRLKALDQNESALEAATGILLGQLANGTLEPADLDRARQLLAQPTIRNARVRTEASTAIALSLHQTKRTDEAIALLQQEADSAGALAYAPTRVRLLGALAELFWSQGERLRALDISRRALEQAEQLKVKLEVQRLGPAWASGSASLYDRHVHHLADLYTAKADPALLEEIHQVTESARFSYLSASRRMDHDSHPADRPDLAMALRALALSGDRLAARPDDPQRQLAYHQAYARVEALQPHKPLRHASQRLDLAAMRARLEPTEMLVVVLGKHVMDITREQVSLRAFAASDDALARLGKAPEAGAGYLSALSDIGTQLFAAAIDNPVIKRILLVPDATSSALPAAALGIDRSAYQPAASRFEILMLPGTRDYFQSDSPQDVQPQRSFLTAIANPSFAGSVAGSDYHRWVQAQPPLSASLAEINHLRDRYSAQHLNMHSGPDANTAALLNASSRTSTILHLATHAYVDRKTGLTGLALSDGLLPAANLSSLRFDNRLVVISTCSSADGSDFANEGRMSLSRSFLAQGAGATVASLWPVADQAAALLMRHFYDALAEGQLAPAALRHAQNQLRAIPRYRDVRYWGGYQLTATTPPTALTITEH